MSEEKKEFAVRVSIDTQFSKWPVYRVRDMENPQDPVEIEKYRKLFEAAPETLQQRDDLLVVLENIVCLGCKCGNCKQATLAIDAVKKS